MKEGDLRVWHIPQIPMTAFRVPVNGVIQAKGIINILADYDIFQFENNIKGDYSNASGLEVFEDGEWCEWSNEYGDCIGDI